MRWIARSAAGVSLVVVSGVVTLALAQPPRPGNPRPPGPTVSVSDAGAAALNPYGGPLPAAGPADAAPVLTAPTSSTGPTAPPPDLYDGGVRPSPLNPTAPEMPDGGAPPQSIDYDKLIGDIAALRARAAAVSDTLFHSRLAVSIETDGDHAKIARLAVSLDDGVVYTAPTGFRADDATTVYDHAVAPGRHAVTVDVERRDDRDESFRTEQRSRFVVDVPNEQRLELDVRIDDGSNMGGDWNSDHDGKYDLRIRASAEAKPVKK